MTLAEVTATVTHRADVLEARLRHLGRRFGRPLRDALVIIGLARALLYFGGPVSIMGVEVGQGIHPWEFLGVDARAYWSVDLAHPYASSGVGVLSTYLYSPAFAQILAPFSLIPFPVFYALWTVMLVGIVIWLVRPWPWALVILALPILYELAVGQVHLLIAASIVVGFTRPAAWALPILTKLTPSIGLLWFAIRQEWRGLAEAVGVTAAIVVVSFILSPSAWFDWYTFLTSSTQRGEALFLRVGVGIVLMVLAALSGRRWLVPVAIWIALPVVWIESWVILLAIIRLGRMPATAAATPNATTAALGSTAAPG